MNHDEIITTIRELVASGAVKTKGAYECLPFEELGFHKNHSAMVIQLAVLADLLGLCSYRDFVVNHKDPFDFCLRTKVPRSSKLVLVTIDEFTGIDQDEPLQNICRYVPVVDGGKLIKIMPPLQPGGEPRRMAIDSEYFIKPCNNMDDFDWNINYDYYFDKCEKLINAIVDEGDGESDE